MMYREEFREEHDHEVICSWDEEKEEFKQHMRANFSCLAGLLEELKERIEKLESDKK